MNQILYLTLYNYQIYQQFNKMFKNFYCVYKMFYKCLKKCKPCFVPKLLYGVRQGTKFVLVIVGLVNYSSSWRLCQRVAVSKLHAQFSSSHRILVFVALFIILRRFPFHIIASVFFYSSTAVSFLCVEHYGLYDQRVMQLIYYYNFT